MITIIKTRVEKRGDISSYIQKPVTNRLKPQQKNDFGFNDTEVAIGVVVDAIELEDSYELTMHIWDRFVSKQLSYQEDKFDSIRISFERQ